MRITLFGFIWIGIVLYAFCSRSYEKMIFVTILSGVFQCNAVVILGNTNGVGPQIFTSAIFIIWYIIKYFPKYSVKFNRAYLCCMLLIFSIVISLIKNEGKIQGTKSLYIIQLLIYINCYFCIIKTKLNGQLDMNKIFLPIVIFVLIIGMIQYLIFLGVIPKLKLITYLLYNETWNGTNAYNLMRKIRLFSTFKEPSYCATFLVGAFYYICYNYDKIKNSKTYLLVIGIEILLTLSTTAYIAVIFCGIVFSVLSNKKKVLKFLIPIGILAIFITIFSGSLETVILKKNTTGSASERNLWNRKAIEAFNKSPIYGVGFKNSRASSIVNNILGELGILGIISYFLLDWSYLKYLLKKKNNKLNYGCLYFMLAVVFSQIITCPDLELCTYWIGMYMIGLSESITRYKEGERNESNSICNYN